MELGDAGAFMQGRSFSFAPDWKEQTKIGRYQTIGMVILGSDKTQLTGHIGDKYCHALYLTSGNIHPDVRSKLGACCWLMIGQIPVVKFKELEHQGLLTNRLFHQCVDIACEDLKACATVPEFFPDAFGEQRLWRTLLAAHVGDLPEQLNIVAASQASSPHSLARTRHFGDPSPKGPRTRDYILDEIDKLKAKCDPLDLGAFKTAAGEIGFNGVHEPYWRDWDHAEPSSFVTIDILHGVTKFGADHPVKWMKKLIGTKEIDRRFSALQRIVNRRHFAEGVTRIKQHTRSEEGDVLRDIVAVSKDAPRVHDGIMKCIRAFADFSYVAQYEHHDEETIGYLEKYLKTFHTYKDAFAAAGLREHFRIPKLEAFQHYARKIRLTGSLPQYSTEITERLHIPMAKQPYRHTNRKDFEIQMCNFLVRNDQVALFETYQQWRNLLDDVTNSMEDEVDTDEEPDLTDVQKELDEAMFQLAALVLPKRTVNFFVNKKTFKTEMTAFRVTNRAHWRNAPLHEVAAKYKLPDFVIAIYNYFNSTGALHGTEVSDIPFTSVEVWKYVRMQHKAVHDDSILTEPQTVMAAPPSEESPFGFCNFVLFAEQNPSYVGIST